MAQADGLFELQVWGTGTGAVTDTPVGNLPDVASFDYRASLNDHGTFRFTYPKNGRGAELISPGTDFEIVLSTRLDSLGTYSEQSSSRFIPLRISHDFLDQDGLVTYEMVTWSWLAKKAAAHDGTALSGDTTTKSRSDNPWYFMITNRSNNMWAESPAAYPTPLPVWSYDASATIDSVIQNYTEAGRTHWLPWKRGFLHTHPSTATRLNQDKSGDVSIDPNMLLTSTSIEYDITDQCTTPISVWNNRGAWSVPATGLTAWGPMVKLSTVEGSGMATANNASMFSSRSVVSSYTLDLTAAIVPAPLKNFHCGQYISVPTVTSTRPYQVQMTSARVYSIGITYDQANGSMTGHIMVGGTPQSESQRLAKAIRKASTGKVLKL